MRILRYTVPDGRPIALGTSWAAEWHHLLKASYSLQTSYRLRQCNYDGWCQGRQSFLGIGGPTRETSSHGPDL